MSACEDTEIASRLDPVYQQNFTDWKNNTSQIIDELQSNYEAAVFDTIKGDVESTLACLQEKYSTELDVANNVNTAQERIVQLQREIKEREEEIQIAKDRVTYIRDPDAHPSYYQSWFPMDRPMRPSSVPLLIGIVVFFTMLILLALLSFLGFNLSVGSSIPGAAPSTSSIIVQWILAQLTLPFWIVLAALVGILIWYRR
jgi:hypothetical protein